MLKVYTLNESIEWDNIVKSFSQYDVYWLSGYVKAFKIHGDGEPLLFFYEDSNTRGINVVMKRDIADDKHFVGKIEKGKYYDFSTPYGYGGWLIEGNDSNTLFNEYEKWCKDNSIISEFVRFHPVIGNQIYSENNYEVIPLGNTVVLDLSSEETIWSNITSKNRNMIRKAQKNDIKIYHDSNLETYNTFREIYNKTMDKDNADRYYYFESEFYESVCNDLKENVEVFYAVKDDKVIASSIMLMANEMINYHLSGSLKEYSSLAPSNLLLYETAIWGCNNGYKTFYLGGGVGSGEDSLYKFKKSFYRLDEVNRFYIGKKIFNKEKYNELIVVREDNIESNYFPKYRA